MTTKTDELVKWIPITQGLFVLVDADDYERLINFKWQAKKAHRNFYATRCSRIGDKRCEIRMHQEILNVTLTKKSNYVVDHLNGNGLDNRKQNLRVCSRSQNAQNRKTSWSATGLLGVYSRKKGIGIRYNACICDKWIGTFDDPISAAIAYNEEALKLFGSQAKLNEIESRLRGNKNK